MKKIIALLLIALVVVVSGCTTFLSSTSSVKSPSTANPIAEAFGGASNPDAGSPPAMPELPG